MGRAVAAVAAYPYRGITAAMYTWCCRATEVYTEGGKYRAFGTVRPWHSGCSHGGIGLAPDKLHQGRRIEGWTSERTV